MKIPTTAAMLKGIKTPEGFTREVQSEKDGWHGTFKVLALTGPGAKIEIEFVGDANSFMLATGHVTFEASGGWRTFDRYGVGDSFYIDNPAKMGGADVIAETNSTIADFVARRIPEAQGRAAVAETVPETGGLTVSPERKEQIAASLRAGKLERIAPAGFGIGYTLLPKPTRFSKRSPKAAAFFGLEEIHIETFDHD